MALMIKCKICGGDVEVIEGATIGTCLYCGSTMTLPRIETEKKARLFNRAHQYRLNCEFDKAYDAYSAIVNEDEQEAEAYWGMLLSEYGIEYVEDPKTHKRVPTCHRTKIQAVTNSTNYQMACQYADSENRMMYQDEAEEIDELQKQIISVAAKEEDYDVFICYKETDDEGNRTEDSVLAESIYNELQKQDIRTFFARISLEDKIGQNYEPYIFAALSSAKVMLVVTTNGMHCKAVWVRNEWARYMNLMENDPDKRLIPVYKDISPYELPGEFVKLQAQDMGKIGASQDLVRGIQKLLGKDPSSGKGMGKEDRLALKQLEEEFHANEKKRANTTIRIVGGLVWLGLAFFMVLAWSYGILSNKVTGYTLGVTDIVKRWPQLVLPCILLGLGEGIGLLALITDIFTVFRIRLMCVAHSVCLAISFAAYLLIHMLSGGIMTAHKIQAILQIAIVMVSLILVLKRLKASAKTALIVAVCIVVFGVGIGAFRFVIPAPAMSNNTGREHKRLTVLGSQSTYINIRKEPSTSADKVGEVYYQQTYSVLSEKTDDTYCWFEIQTAQGIHGYIAAEKGHVKEYYDIRESLQKGEVTITVIIKEINIRAGGATSYKKIGKVKQGDVLDVWSITDTGTMTWYEIETADGIHGFVGSNNNDPYVEVSGN